MELLRYLVALPEEYNPDPTFRYAAVSVVLGAAAWISGESTHKRLARQSAEVVISSGFAVPLFSCVALLGLSLIAVTEGDPAECRSLHGDLIAYRGTSTGSMFVDRILGLLAHAMGELDTAAAHLEEALAFCERTKHRPERAWVAHAYAETLLARNASGDRAMGMEYLEQAEAAARELAMPPLAERVQASRAAWKPDRRPTPVA